MKFYFSSQQVESIFGISRKVLFYWKKTNLFQPAIKTHGNHARYTFQDLVANKTIKALQDAGISTFKIKKVATQLKKLYPDSKNPFAEKSLYVVGKEVTVMDREGSYNPLTGQETFIKNKDMKMPIRDTAFKDRRKTYRALTGSETKIDNRDMEAWVRNKALTGFNIPENYDINEATILRV